MNSGQRKTQGDGNPYVALHAAFLHMVMMTYRIPDSIRQIAMQGEFNEFDLNVFFSAKGKVQTLALSMKMRCRSGWISFGMLIWKPVWMI